MEFTDHKTKHAVSPFHGKNHVYILPLTDISIFIFTKKQINSFFEICNIENIYHGDSMQQCEQWDTTLNVIIIGQIHFFTVIGQYINSKVFFLSNFRRKKSSKY